MVHGYHVIFGAYGFWLPNDPRGSWSDFVGKWELTRFGKSTKSLDRKLELTAEESKRLAEAKASLDFPCVHFSPTQIDSIAKGFEQYAIRNGVTIWAASILPEHVHLVIGRHRFKMEQLVRLLKGEATKQMIKDGCHPLIKYSNGATGSPPTPWAVGKWIVYLDSETAIDEAIHYVEENPDKEGLPRQSWKFVQPFRGIDWGKGWVTY